MQNWRFAGVDLLGVWSHIHQGNIEASTTSIRAISQLLHHKPLHDSLLLPTIGQTTPSAI
eukprot:c40854_g1_i1 orf=33-212(-)